MNRFLVLILLIFSIDSFSQFADWLEDEQKGGIIKITWINYYINSPIDTVSDLSPISYIVEYYNDNNDKIKREKHDSLFNLEWTYQFDFNNERECFQETWKSGTGNLLGVISRNYLNSDKFIEHEYDEESNLEAIRVVDYNPDNTIKQERKFDSDSILIEKRNFEYTISKRVKTEKIDYIRSNSTYTHDFEYIDSLNFIERVFKNDAEIIFQKYDWSYNNDRTECIWLQSSTFGINKTLFEYQYDSIGNWVSRFRTDSIGRTGTIRYELVKRIIEYK